MWGAAAGGRLHGAPARGPLSAVLGFALAARQTPECAGWLLLRCPWKAHKGALSAVNGGSEMPQKHPEWGGARPQGTGPPPARDVADVRPTQAPVSRAGPGSIYAQDLKMGDLHTPKPPAPGIPQLPNLGTPVPPSLRTHLPGAWGAPGVRLDLRGLTLRPPPQKRNRAITARRQHLKSVMLQIAATELEKEEGRRESEKQNYLAEHCPPLHIPGSMAEVQELCKQLHSKIDEAEEEKYDMEVKVQKSTKELEDMNQKLFDLRGKFKRPPLRRVRMSADAMLKALLGSKHKVCMDLRANLKQVKKEDTEKERDLRDVGDWRKNIEEKSGMEGRKKMFESES
ncbi:troponin I, fast skeletal muscle [Erinaceus europaeus]|uniref:Troponin I, fast skeletal muscle n=1 Tax=Erinaceus europaeus TaxID=9365 RepID=A0ABM3W9U5_ERIEU|nr:troponin I, fast skeletal muscle [Erinaceus europaeus]